MRARRLPVRGFTLTELVVVIVIAGILAAFAFSRINVVGFDNEGFANRAAAMVRYAQKIAISQRRTVFVITTVGPPSNIRLCYPDVTTPCDRPLREPPGTNAFSYNAPSGVSLSPANFFFNALGRPSAAQAITVTDGVTPRTITVEAETGYVH